MRYPRVKNDLRRKISPVYLKVMKLLRDGGFGFARIASILGVAKTTVRYHLQPDFKRRVIKAVWENRKIRLKERNGKQLRKYYTLLQRKHWKRRYYKESEFKRWMAEANRIHRGRKRKTNE